MKRITPPSKEELKTLYPRNSLKIIGKMKGVSHRTVWKWCRDYELQMRSRGGVTGRLKRPDIKTEALVRAFEKGLKPPQIAKRFGTSHQVVNSRLLKASVRFPNRKYRRTDLPWPEIRRLYEGENWSQEKLAKEFNTGKATIHRGLKKMGVRIRKRTAHMVAWHAEQKQKLADVDRLRALEAKGILAPKEEPKPKRMTRETKARITARAYFRITGKSQWDLAKDGDLYPRQRVTDVAYKSIWTFDRDYELQIEAEVVRLRQLDPAEQRAASMTALSNLRT